MSPCEAARTGCSSPRELMRGWRIQECEDLSIWLRNNGFAGSAAGNHIAARAQEFLLGEAVAIDARVALLEAVHVCLTVHISRQLAVPPPVSEPPSEWSRGGRLLAHSRKVLGSSWMRLI